MTWSLTIDLGAAPFNGAAAGAVQTAGSDGWRYQVTANQPSAGFARVSGTPGGGRATTSGSTTYLVELCAWSLPAGVDTPSAYTVSTTQGPAWTVTQACLTTTVTGNGTSQFYVGWATAVDLAPAIARLAEGGNARTGWTYGPDKWRVTRTVTGPASFTVSSRSPSTIAGTQSFPFLTCAVSD